MSMTDAEPGRLEGKVAAVTGGAQNIGLATARALAARGATVALLDVNLEGANAASGSLRADGLRASAWALEVTSAASVNGVFEAVIGEFGRLDILVNNAGITRDALLVRMSDDDWARVIGVNLTGTFLCTRAVTRQMMRQKSGRIVNIASVIGLMGNAGQANYAASKAGIIGFTKATAKELAARNITVNAIAPGAVEGDRIASVIAGQAKVRSMAVEDVRKQFVERAPLKRMSTPSDIATLALYLCSPAARNLSGQCIAVTAGEPAM